MFKKDICSKTLPILDSGNVIRRRKLQVLFTKKKKEGEGAWARRVPSCEVRSAFVGARPV